MLFGAFYIQIGANCKIFLNFVLRKIVLIFVAIKNKLALSEVTMKKFAFVLGLMLLINTNAWADICYDVNDEVATRAVDIIGTQNEIYQYCSICSDSKPKTISVNNVQKGNPVYVDGIALDLAHTYYKHKGKFINIGVASGCIKAGEHHIASELESFEAHTKEKNKIKELKKKFFDCSDTFNVEEKKCSEMWKMKCYNHLMQAHKNVQKCYKQTAIELFKTFYELSEKDAEKKYDTFQKFMYDQYLFVYTESDYCKKNNCGVSVYLYSEYATTQELYSYVNKIIASVTRQ